jgi:hypothetical protein
MARYIQITQHIRYAPSVLAFRDINTFDRNIVYDWNVSVHWRKDKIDDRMIKEFLLHKDKEKLK